MRKFLLSLFMVSCLTLSACGILRTYRGDITQGSLVTDTQVKQLKTGMTQPEVRKLLGSPVMSQPFNQHQLVYLYRFQPGYGTATQQELVLDFSRSNRLVHYHFEPMTAVQ